jgi:hypothetical protein
MENICCERKIVQQKLSCVKEAKQDICKTTTLRTRPLRPNLATLLASARQLKNPQADDNHF